MSIIITSILLYAISEITPKASETAQTTLNQTKKTVEEVFSRDYAYAKKKCSYINKRKVIINHLKGENVKEISDIFFRDCSIVIENNIPYIKCSAVIAYIKYNYKEDIKCFTNVSINCLDKKVEIGSSNSIKSISICGR